MPRFKGVLASTTIDAQGDQLDMVALARIENQAGGMPVMFDFNPEDVRGRVERAKQIGNTIEATFTLNVPKSMAKGLYIVPCLTYNLVKSQPDGTRLLQDVTLRSVSLTTHPADPSLPPIEAIPLSGK